MKKWIALLLSLCMLLSTAALAETATEEVPAAETAVAADTMDDATVLATLYGEDITWAQVAPIYEELVIYYGPYYDLADPANVNLFRAVALDTFITQKVVNHKATELGMTLTDEEKTEAETTAQTAWDNAIADYIANNEGATEADAVAYYNQQGYSPEKLKADYVAYATEDKVRQTIVQDVVVTDEEVETLYQELVATDKELYGSDVSAYVNYNGYVDQMAMYAMYYGTESNLDYAWYRPAGFRLVKHILLPVDETLMSNYQGLQAQYEEQLTAEEGEAVPAEGEAAPAEGEAAPAEEEAAAEPVTQTQVDEAKAAILDSVSGTVLEIEEKLANGANFDELMAEYSMDYQEGGANAYEVSVASTLTYVPEFVEAAFSVENPGEHSAPYISAYGVHIVLYVEDIPEGPIEMTDAQRELKRDQLLTARQDEVYTTTVEGWIAEAGVVYTGVIPSLEEILAEQATEDEIPVEEPAEETAVEETTEEAPAEETPAEETPAEETTEEAPAEEVPAE